MNNKLTPIVLSTCLLALGASCNVDDNVTDPNSDYAVYESSVSEVILVSELSATSTDGRAVVDVGLEGVGYWVEPGTNLADVDVLCPNGRTMTLQQEVELIGMPLADQEDGIFIYRPGVGKEDSVADQEKNAPECRDACQAIYEGPGQWHCEC